MAARLVFAAADFDGEQDVTYEHVASIAVFGRDVQKFGEWFTELGTKLGVAALEDLETIRREGRQMNIPQFDANGARNFDEGRLTEQASHHYLAAMLADA